MIKILVVDDESDITFLFKQQFRKEIRASEFTFHFAHSGEQALEFLQKLDPFDIVLVLSDINMPGMSGLELLRHIRQKFPDLRVMMVTAYGDQKNHDEAVRSGASDFVTKPVDFTLLKEKILQLKNVS